MKNTFAVFFFSSLVFGRLGYSQTLCDSDSATPFSPPSNVDSSSGDLANAEALARLGTFGSTAALDIISKTRKRQSDLSCTASENCRSAGSALLCYNEQTGDFHDPDGTTGNLITGNYTTSDGQKGNLYRDIETAAASGSASSSNKATAPVSSAAPTGSGASSSSNNAASVSPAVPTGSGASSSSNNAASASSAANTGNSGASSSLQSLYNITFAVVTSMIAGSLLREIFRF